MESNQLNACDDETLDTFYNGELKISQKKKGYRFSIDAVLLAAFVLRLKGETIIDIGVGCGVVPLMIARKNPTCKIVGVEIQDSLFDLACRNIKENGYHDRINIIKHDVRDIKTVFKQGSFDIVTANPPYIKIDSGRINMREEKAIARHEIMVSIEELVKTANYLLNNTGKIVVVYPVTRAIDLIDVLRSEKIEPKFMQVVHSDVQSEGKLVIVEASKSAKKGGLKILPPCIIYENGTTYTKEIKTILKG